MKILVMSDNHGRWQKVQEIIDYYHDKVDYILHCGDSEFPADDPIWDNVEIVVSGNMDFDPSYRQHEVLKTNEGTILITHGHRHNVNHSLADLEDLADKYQADIIFYGHTHRLESELLNGKLFLNPGSLSHSRGDNKERTFALVTFDESDINIQYIDDEFNEVERLREKYSR